MTDSGANFVKAFRHFSMEEAEELVLPPDETNEDETEEDMAFEEINEQLNPTANVDDADVQDEEAVYKLPPHRKCACHLLNLIATKDSGNIDGITKRTSVQTFARLTGLWNKQNRSALVAEDIRRALGCLLVTPGDTRWNSTLDAVVKIRSIINDPELETKFDKLCDNIITKHLLPAHKTFVREYVEVMAPIACALDVLQGEKSMGLGYLLPTLTVVKTQLQQLLERPTRLVICQPLVHALLDGVNTRFGEVFDEAKSKLAAVVHPRFKLDWMDGPAQKADMIEMLKRSVTSQQNSERGQEATILPQPNPDPQPVTPNAAIDFFSCFTSRRQATTNEPDVTVEVDKYFADPSVELSSLSKYPHIRNLYIQLNTGLPASAAVERLFSLSGRVFSPLRSKLSSSHLEMLVFLRLSKW